MITISSTLQDAAEAESRAPLVGVDVIQKRIDLQVYDSISYGVHRLEESSNGFWVATGYSIYTAVPIVACKLTTLLSSSWTSGWVSATSAETNPIVHDLYVDGDDCYIFYEHMNSTTPELYMVTSSNGGASWGTPTLVQNLGAAGANIFGISIASPTLVWVAFGTSGTSVKLLRFEYVSSWSYTDFTIYISDDVFDFCAASSSWFDWQLFSRPVDDYTEAIIFNSTKGFTAGDQWDGVFVMHVHNAGDGDTDIASVSHVQTSLGCLETDLDYKYRLRGLSRDSFGGFYIGGMYETYNKYTDASGEEAEDEFFLCRTRDGNAFQLIPIGMPAFSYREPDNYMIGGVVNDTDDTLVIAMTNDDSTKILYANPTWLAGYDTGTAIESDLVESVSITRSVREISKATIALSNAGGDYDPGDALVTEGNIIRISAGYKTSYGDEAQERFSGEIVTTNNTRGPDKTTTLDVYDTLYPATLGLGRPHVLIGQNTTHIDFSAIDDHKKMVDQVGVWEVSSNRYTQSELGVDAFSLCGYDPDDVYSVAVKMRANSSINDVRMGIVIGYDPNELTSNLCTVICYNETNSRIEYGYLDSDGDYSYQEYIFTSLTWSADTDYWLRIDRTHGVVSAVFYSTDGITWDGDSWSTPYELSPKTFPGIYCYTPTADGVSVGFSSADVISMKYPMSGSDVMKYLATTIGVGTDEKFAVNDEFTGSAFADGWEEGPFGSWSVSGGSALGIGGASYPAEACYTKFTVEDVIVKVYMTAVVGTGISLRSNCGDQRYEVIMDYTTRPTFDIRKFVDNSETLLCSVEAVTGVGPSAMIELTFAAIGVWLYAFVNGVLVAYVEDDDISSGFVGIVSETTSPTTSDHQHFIVDGFYKPVPGAIIINAKDTSISIMTQVADLMPGGQFFCNEVGNLKWGVFPEDEDADLNVEGVVVSADTTRGLDRIITNLNMVGNNAYANARFAPWSYRLSRHLYEQVEDKYLSSGNDIYIAASKQISQTNRISEHSATIRANPALELCDIVVIENGVVQLYDTFTGSGWLEDHTPDIDLNGSGWECDTEHGWYITNNEAAASQYYASDPTYIDVGITDYILEFDTRAADTYGIGIAEDVYVRFRKNTSNSYSLVFYFDIGAISLNGPGGRLDGSDEAGIRPDSWVHVKVICSGTLILAICTSNGIETILSHSGATDQDDRTYIELDFENHYPDSPVYIDNFVVYTPDIVGQIMSMSESVGSVYEMTLSGLLGDEEYR